MRIILYTGKGGVGKTSVTAATAYKIASEGKKVLVMSTDQAHSLGDSFQIKLSSTPTRVDDNLDALEIDAIRESENAWGTIRKYLEKLMSKTGGETIETEELMVFPGFEELVSLFKIKEIYKENKYDVLLVDCAPTGETLSLLKYPEMFGEMMNKIIPMKRKALKIAGPTVEKVMKIPMPEDQIFDEIEMLCQELEELKAIMDNKEVVSVRIVTTPEKIVIREAKRNFSFLHLYHYNVDAIIVNRIYPNEALEGYFSRWIELQELALQDIRESFYGLEIFTLPLQKKEIIGKESLLEAAELLYYQKDPLDLFFQDKIFELSKEDGVDYLEIYIPFFDKSDFDIQQKGEEVQIVIQNERRKIFLPSQLKGQEIEKANYENGKLKLRFSKRT